MIKKIQNLLHARSGKNSRVPNSIRAVSFILSVVVTTAGIGYAVVFAANTTIGNNIVTSGSLTVGGTTTFNTIAYTWPSADGSSGQVLSTNGAGVLSWAAGGGGSSLFTDGGTTSYLTSTDNLGVGTTSTAFKLGIQGNALFSGNISAANMTATGSLNITNGSTGPAEIYLNTNGVNVALLGGHSDNSFDIFMNGMTPPAFYIGPGSSGGYIGMATNTPSQRLSVQGNALFSGNISSVANITATGTITIGHIATTSAMLYVSDGTATGTPGMPGLSTAVPAWFVSNSSVPVVGLENTSVGVRMGFTAFSDDDGAHSMLGTFTNHPLAFEINSSDEAGDNIAMWITTGKKIGIGTTTPPEKLSVIGNIALSGNLLPTLTPAVTASSSVPSVSGKITEPGSNAVPSGHALAIGIDGFPIIAYRNVTDSSLKVTKCGDADCYAATTTTTVIGAGLVGVGDQSISIALGSDGLPWITYSQATDLSLRLVKCANTSCSATTSDLFVDGVAGVTPGPNVSTSTSIAITNDGTVKIAYYDATNGELRFANCVTLACTSFSTSTMDGVGVTDVGAFNSMTVLPDDSIAISYYDITNADLKMIKCKGPTCSGSDATTVDSTTSANVGKYTSIAIATDGMPIISYYDVTNADLRVAKCLDFWCGTKSLYSIDSTGDVGQYSSITIGSDGFPIISYYDVINSDLKTAKCSNSTCSVANDRNSLYTDNSGTYSSIAIGADGMPFVVFYSGSGTHVRYFKCTGQNCHGTAAGYLVGGSDLGSLGKFFNNAYVESLWAKQISIKRFDLAEDYYSREDLNPGEIVSLDPSEALHIKKASNDGSRVIGIVSTEPALVLSDFTAPVSNDKNYPIALAGRVPVKVNSEGGSIAIGDPITLSSVSGIGKRATDGEKTIGYALDSFAGVNGTIRVFVNLNGANSSVMVDSSSSLLGQVIGVVKNWLEGMKVTIEDGLVTMKDLIAERITALGVTTIDLKVGTAEIPSGITLFDKNTNLPYCVTVTDGQLQTAAGECVTAVPEPSVPADPSLDTTAPVITLNGSAIIETPRGSAWSDPGATVVDPASGSNPENTNLSIYYNVDGTDTANEGRELPTIDTAENGLHTITYTSTDSSGNVGTTSRIVNVVDPI